jgi:hypothetical protein
MAENFTVQLDEAIDCRLSASWIKGVINNHTGQMIMTSQRLVFCARNRAITYALTGPLLDAIIKSEKIRFQIAISDIKSVTFFKRMGLKTNFRIKSKRWEGEEFVFTFNPGAKSAFLSWCNKVNLEIKSES